MENPHGVEYNISTQRFMVQFGDEEFCLDAETAEDALAEAEYIVSTLIRGE